MLSQEVNTTLDGIRYKAKRKYKDIDKVKTNSEIYKENIQIEQNFSKKQKISTKKHEKSKIFYFSYFNNLIYKIR